MEPKRINQEQIKSLLDYIIELSDYFYSMSLSNEMKHICQEYKIEHLHELTVDQFEEIMANYYDAYTDLCDKYKTKSMSRNY